MASALTIEPGDALRVIRSYREKPIAFSRDVLGSHPWRKAREIMRAIARPHAIVNVKGAHGTAKTRTGAEVVAWWVATGGVAVTTAARFAQVRHGLWRRLRELHAGARVPLGGGLNLTDWTLTPDAYAIGYSTIDETKFQGSHEARLLFVVDEAPGVSDGIFRAIAGARSGGDVRELRLGNPNPPHGKFFEAFQQPRPGVTCISISAFDSPNLRDVGYKAAGVGGPGRTRELTEIPDDELDAGPRPYLATARWVLEMAADFGVESPYFRWKVLGEYAEDAEDALILQAWIEAQRYAELEPGPDDVVEAGIDVAGSGEDEHACAVRRGPRGLAWMSTRETDPERIVGKTVRFLEDLPQRPTLVKYDSIGVGAYFGLALERAGFRAEAVNVAERADNPKRFKNRRAEIHWAMRERFREGLVCGIDDDRALSQLGTIQWSTNSVGQTVIEAKDEMRARGLPSPDRAEAWMLAFAPSVAGPVVQGAMVPDRAARFRGRRARRTG